MEDVVVVPLTTTGHTTTTHRLHNHSGFLQVAVGGEGLTEISKEALRNTVALTGNGPANVVMSIVTTREVGKVVVAVEEVSRGISIEGLHHMVGLSLLSGAAAEIVVMTTATTTEAGKGVTVTKVAAGASMNPHAIIMILIMNTAARVREVATTAARVREVATTAARVREVATMIVAPHMTIVGSIRTSILSRVVLTI